MKIRKSLLTGALSLFLLSACSSEDVPDNGGQTVQSSDGYIAVSIQLPTSTATRAYDNLGQGSNTGGTNNDNFDNGDASEYAVESGILLLFRAEKPDNGTDAINEADAKFVGAFDLGFPRRGDTPPVESPNVTTNYRFAVKVAGLALGESDVLYGLAMLNNNRAGISLDSENSISIDGVNIPADGKMTFGELLSKTSEKNFMAGNNDGSIAEYIFMCNAPMANKPGGVSIPVSTDSSNPFRVTTLVNLSKSLQPTPQDALEHPAGTIYVERALAKVTLSKILEQESVGNGIETGIEVVIGNDETIGSDNKVKLVIKDVEWAIGNEEKSSYYVRNVAGIDNWALATEKTLLDPNTGKYRMVSSSALLANITAGSASVANDLIYRTYWCVDPNYTNIPNSTDENPIYSKLGTPIKWNGGQAFYPHENTFDVANMKYSNTTRVGLWITMALSGEDGPKNFYTRNTDKNTIYFDNGELNPMVSNVLYDLSKDESVKEAWRNALVVPERTGSEEFKVNDLITLITETGEDGRIVLTSIEFTSNNDLYGEGKLPVYDFTTMIQRFNIAYQFYEYTGGKVFYEFRIKHFGDNLTPWSASATAGSINESYGDDSDTRDNNYLGRWGMVRNNWYDVTISNLLNLGDPRDPAIWDTTWGETPDDNKDQYIALDIAILSWAKRVQNVDF